MKELGCTYLHNLHKLLLLLYRHTCISQVLRMSSCDLINVLQSSGNGLDVLIHYLQGYGTQQSSRFLTAERKLLPLHFREREHLQQWQLHYGLKSSLIIITAVIRTYMDTTSTKYHCWLSEFVSAVKHLDVRSYESYHSRTQITQRTA